MIQLLAGSNTNAPLQNPALVTFVEHATTQSRAAVVLVSTQVQTAQPLSIDIWYWHVNLATIFTLLLVPVKHPQVAQCD